jgi:hypothetical protein
VGALLPREDKLHVSTDFRQRYAAVAVHLRRVPRSHTTDSVSAEIRERRMQQT